MHVLLEQLDLEARVPAVSSRVVEFHPVPVHHEHAVRGASHGEILARAATGHVQVILDTCDVVVRGGCRRDRFQVRCSGRLASGEGDEAVGVHVQAAVTGTEIIEAEGQGYRCTGGIIACNGGSA